MNNDKFYSQALKQARKDAKNAKNGKTHYKGETYYFTFNRKHSCYHVTQSDGQTVLYLNTRKITEAKRWLKEYLEN